MRTCPTHQNSVSPLLRLNSDESAELRHVVHTGHDVVELGQHPTCELAELTAQKSSVAQKSGFSGVSGCPRFTRHRVSLATTIAQIIHSLSDEKEKTHSLASPSI